MKLYNLFEEIILEEIERNRTLLTEGVSFDDVKAAIDGKYNVNILYRDYEDQPPSKRYIQVYNLAKTKSGNDAIRAYQIFGASKKGNKNGFWKIFRLDRIEGWFPTKVRWARPVSDIEPNIPKYNANGDRSMSSVIYKANVNQPINTKNV
jgi:predicted DNA-binding transcriptional regulator YafY